MKTHNTSEPEKVKGPLTREKPELGKQQDDDSKISASPGEYPEEKEPRNFRGYDEDNNKALSKEKKRPGKDHKVTDSTDEPDAKDSGENYDEKSAGYVNRSGRSEYGSRQANGNKHTGNKTR